ncbi:MAG: tRNA (N6-threonylcarbamoyladenosine(37)-N6)-methyltransferase TrmO [Thermodesulfobacteriota bacterium]|nr:tRNA (N6-threonylcarbamoyladenosine(37)-N6)-methyltransferase TrmO [Thermodesulfobacteriota bacterium]
MKPIGIIHSPYKEIENMPIQSVGAKDVKGYIEIYADYVPGLKDLNGFSHIYVIYKFHTNKNYSLLVKPFLDNTERGLFSTRAPKRPNQIGLSIFKIESIDNEKIYVSGVDVLDQTPLLDIKPYVSKFDAINDSKNGWLENVMRKSEDQKSDRRFE